MLTLACPLLHARAPAANTPTLGKIYMRMLDVDQTLQEDVPHLPKARREEYHELFMARWRYMHHHAMVGAAVVDPEFWDREWSTEGADDEESEWAQFEATVKQVAQTPGAAEDGHTEAAILADYSDWTLAMKTAGEGVNPKMSQEKINQAQRMPSWKWWQTYGRPWPHLRWFAMRLLSMVAAASACERNWSAYEWIHSKKRNRLGVTRAEKLVRSYATINLTNNFSVDSFDFVPWDLEMIFDDDEAEPDEGGQAPVAPSSSPTRAASASEQPRRSPRNQATATASRGSGRAGRGGGRAR